MWLRILDEAALLGYIGISSYKFERMKKLALVMKIKDGNRTVMVYSLKS